MLYIELANRLLRTIENGEDFFQVFDENHLFEYKKNYSGLMAYINPKFKKYARIKQGLFDIKGTMYNSSLTHNQIFQMLLENTTIDECISIWRGIWPENANRNPLKYDALIALLMMMFEQEINFGNETFQRKSHFSPKANQPNSKRPRDLLMGYVIYVFAQGNIECLRPYEQNGTVKMPSEELKNGYFCILENDEYAQALMANPEVVNRFRGIASISPDNPAI